MGKASSTEKKPMTPSDTTKIKGVSNPQISPDGTKVAFVVSVVDMAENRSKTDIWVTAAKGGTPVNVTNDGSSSTPRWSPDGKTLAFFFSEKGKRQLCLMSPDGGNRRVLTAFETSNAYISRTGESLAWAPDGSAIAFLATDEPKPDYSEIVVMERLLTKSLTEFSDFRRTHIFVVSPEGGEPRQLTSGEFDEHSICWTADSQEIVFVSDRSGQGDLFVRNDLWAVSPATKTVRQITSTLGAAYTPVCSPKGKKIAYLSTTRPDTSNDSVAEGSHLWVVSTDGEGAKDLVKKLDRPCSSIVWTPDGKKILFSASDRGQAHLYSVSPDGGEISTVIQGGYSSRGGFSVSVKGRKMAFLKQDPCHPAEVYVASLDGSGEKQLTDFNGELVEEFSFSTPGSFWFPSFDGVEVQGWVVKPYGFDSAKKYPTLLCIHGGPHGMYGYSFSEADQIFTGAGYVVVKTDPRGSSGYGQKFSDGCVLNWGGGDYKDLMAGLDYAVAHNDFIDKNRLGVTGGSYGGYMTNWVVTQTNRFKAAVARACVSNLLSFYGTSMKFSLIEQEFNGLPYDNPSLLAQWSPVTHVKNVKTPLLLLHGEADYTCPIGQAEEMFIGVKRLGVDTQLVRYQGEGHGISRKPSNRIDFYQRHLDWFKKYLK